MGERVFIFYFILFFAAESTLKDKRFCLFVCFLAQQSEKESSKINDQLIFSC